MSRQSHLPELVSGGPRRASDTARKSEEFSAVSRIVPLSREQCPAAVGDDSGPSFLRLKESGTQSCTTGIDMHCEG